MASKFEPLVEVALEGGSPSGKAAFLPVPFILALAGMAAVPQVRNETHVLWAFWGAAGLLAAWWVALTPWRRLLRIDVALRKQHYLQACAQGAVFLYWGWYWPQVYASFHLLIAQLLFAYAFDMLLSWSRRTDYTLGFAPFPVVFSTNLFLWFKPDWFYLQFLMVGVGLAAKELIRWSRDGRRVHIFNPSSFPLAVFSLALLITGKSGITWGQDIANTQFYPPQMYLMLFLIGLPGQFFFGVTSMTMSAVLATYAFGLAYHAATGIYFFYDSYIPIAVFLGMHLLFCDPSTSPKTEVGRIVYGVMYGLSTVLLYELLGRAGMPTFYDKLLQVPLLNLSVRFIDRYTGKVRAPSRRRNLAYIGVWATAFVVMSATEGVGDRHPGQYVPFWQKACDDGRSYACPYLADLDLSYCNQGSAWACNDAGLMHIALARSGEDLRRVDPGGAREPFTRGCERGLAVACRNLNTLMARREDFKSVSPSLDDWKIVLRGSKGQIREKEPQDLYALACREGWSEACGSVAR
jgi:hypothetical protein